MTLYQFLVASYDSKAIGAETYLNALKQLVDIKEKELADIRKSIALVDKPIRKEPRFKIGEIITLNDGSTLNVTGTRYNEEINEWCYFSGFNNYTETWLLDNFVKSVSQRKS